MQNALALFGSDDDWLEEGQGLCRLASFSAG